MNKFDLKKGALKTRLAKKEITVGSWITMNDPAVAEIMSAAGFDWLTVDMEHSGLSFNQAQDLIRVIELCGVVPLVRVMENNSDQIKKFMDIGAHGVIVPQVNTKEDAEKAIHAVKYPPFGTRGVGLSRAQNYSLNLDDYVRWNQENSIVIIQVEHIKAVENLESIMSVDGIDGFIIGLYDLSGSLGCPGDFEDKRVIDALEEIKNKANKYNYLMGQHIVKIDPQQVIDKINQNIRFIGFGVDFLFLGECCNKSLREIKRMI